MSSTAFNLLLAFLLLAANAFYVAAEFALVKSRGFRIKVMVEQDRFGARPYSFEQFGLSKRELEPVFEEYLATFDVELEPLKG